jgi:hypothetical protein
MTTVNIILWVFIAVQIGLLIGLFVMGVRMLLAERRRRMKESVAHAVDRWVEEVKTPTHISPPSFATNYLLNEGFLLLIRKPDQSIKLTTPAGGENLLAYFTVDHHTGTPILINGVTNERVAVDSEFINHWLTTNYTER